MNASISVDPRETHELHSDADVVRVRQLARALAVSAEFSLVDQTKLVTAVSELARNTLLYGGGGTAELELVTEGDRRGVRATFTDKGPGIADIALALTDGWSSGTGMGLGLPGARRLVDDFDLQSSPGVGTTVSVVKWSP
ncbi:anti-sigma regulatory factor [Nocardioides mesophilus]|uniref:Anti-sigma regulatory factor n=1 Tax=Nocardioides mesophilus TaxID=433659 RepID=A0A7G9RCH7_9ACTN|nr:anti-sigma regulatory factor [Nocardioides mesophilus]QNN53302.1 anti-sigma regulatory factor [Nocardioides mesophilus]